MAACGRRDITFESVAPLPECKQCQIDDEGHLVECRIEIFVILTRNVIMYFIRKYNRKAIIYSSE